MPLPPPRKPLPPPGDPAPDFDPADSRSRMGLPEGRPPLPPAFAARPRRGNPLAILFSSLGLAALVLVTLFWLLSDNSAGPVSLTAKVDEARGWVRLNPLPKSAKNIAFINPDESPDRRYHIIFEAPTAEIERWLAISPGTANANPEFYDATTFRYRIPASPADPAGRSGEIFYSAPRGAVNISIGLGSREGSRAKFK